MTKQTSKYLSSEHQTIILEAVRQAEACTSGEIAPMLVAESDDYREAAMRAAVIMAAVLSTGVALAVNDTTIWLFIPLATILYFPLVALANRLPALKLAFTPAAYIREAVRLRAVRAFHERGLHRTREGNGILIFISLLERKVWILGDRGINTVIPPERWTSLASGLAAGIRAGRMTETLAATISEVGGILKEHFPHRGDDSNELPDLLED
ncbi:MAG: TPM domain-containing protein [Desulfuromonadaceae bacterium]|nr:TPM domain-containing protein [Desulfuromonadaceae bacterium]MDD2848676.1 TPM domain-containing protein [Desulfuromonadaceae bacterium]MDD4130821.1 TPM domain-containing protein [Desulfuromonadaceae bacterium]